MVAGDKLGLFAGVSLAIDRALDLENYRTRTSALRLANRQLDTAVGRQLVSNVFDQLSGNWNKITAGQTTRPSSENFRWFKPQRQIGASNRSPEVTLERALIASFIAARRTDWSNQVPLISGLAGAVAYKRWAVDLVHQTSTGFEFVELKVNSDTPLSAAMQILQYGMLWLLSRNERHRLGYNGNPILESRALHLSVLAPFRFYDRVHNQHLPEVINAGLYALGEHHGVALSFSQTAFPAPFRWPSNMPENELIEALQARHAL